MITAAEYLKWVTKNIDFGGKTKKAGRVKEQRVMRNWENKNENDRWMFSHIKGNIKCEHVMSAAQSPNNHGVFVLFLSCVYLLFLWDRVYISRLRWLQTSHCLYPSSGAISSVYFQAGFFFFYCSAGTELGDASILGHAMSYVSNTRTEF